MNVAVAVLSLAAMGLSSSLNLVAANTDIPAQLKDLSRVLTAPPTLPATLAPALKTRLGDRKLSSLSAALQRALLWEAGQIVTAADPSKYVDVYVLCGQTMNNVFVGVDAVEADASCPLKKCKTYTYNLALSTCAASALEKVALCAVVADGAAGGSGSTALTSYTGPLWAQEGSLDQDYAPTMYQNSFTNGSGSIFVIAQDSAFKGTQDTCGQTPQFTVPCRKVTRKDVTETTEEKKWCRPAAQLGVQLWYNSETTTLTPSSSSGTATTDKTAGSGASGTTSTTGTTTSDSKSSSTVTVVLGIALGVAVVLCGVLLVMVLKRKNQRKDGGVQTPGYTTVGNGTSGGGNSSTAASMNNNNNGSTHRSSVNVGTLNSVNVEAANEGFKQKSAILAAFCDDQELMMKRVAYAGLTFGKLIASGANGEVWRGEYQGHVVAIKKALGDKKDDIKTLEAFSQEIRLASTLEHPNIVRFIGLSWRALPDLCMVSEFMAVGDLAHFLPTQDGQSMTWANEKISLASDIANALVYLHSLMPVIIHRDLKSLNVLLTDDLQAKLSDFGLSREQSFEQTMTSGVGTMLWTAPEVLRGERYSEKADIYSFGIVLSELDTCLAPYSLNEEVAGVKSKSMHLLPLISKGQITPKFSPDCPEPVLELAKACLDQDPSKRPPAMQVVYTLRSKIRPLL
ncbi:Tkl protein kinase [Globisporangium polare]